MRKYFDENYVTEQYGVDIGTDEIKELYFTELENHYEELRDILNVTDTDRRSELLTTLKTLAHSMKSPAGLVGDEELRLLSFLVERSSYDGEVQAAFWLATRLEPAVKEALDWNEQNGTT